eukprot:1147889-Pelagomonas_calceolata.AAC.1
MDLHQNNGHGSEPRTCKASRQWCIQGGAWGAFSLTTCKTSKRWTCIKAMGYARHQSHEEDTGPGGLQPDHLQDIKAQEQRLNIGKHRSTLP